jgi:glycosyltransferase involved in cell wall biosynthesis
MTILFITSWYFPAKVGGGSQMVKNYAEELAKQDNDVEIWTTDYLNGRVMPIEKVEKRIDYINGVKVVYHKSFFHRWQAKTKQVITFELFKKLFTKEIDKFDYINIVESKSLFSMFIMNILRWKKKNIAHFAFGSLGQEKLNFKHKLYDFLILKSFLNNNCSLFFAQTEHEMENYKKYLDKSNCKKIRLLPLAVNVEENISQGKKYKGVLSKILKLQNDEKLFLYLGRLTENKGIKRLIESFSRTNPKTNNLFLAIVGYDEGYKKILENYINALQLNDVIKILGPVYGNERYGYYHDADYFIITSTFYEETSLASLEALSVGKPVITTPEVELPYLDEYKAGYQAESNVKDISNKIEQIIEMDYDFISNNALKLAHEKFDITKVVKLLTNYYKGD